jgi:hypothetical protein
MNFIDRITLSSFTEQLKKRIGNTAKSHNQIDEILTGFEELDNYTMGFKPGDLILLLYRPEYYKLEEWDDEQNSPANGEAEIIITKNNYGKLTNIRITWNILKSSSIIRKIKKITSKKAINHISYSLPNKLQKSTSTQYENTFKIIFHSNISVNKPTCQNYFLYHDLKCWQFY